MLSRVVWRKAASPSNISNMLCPSAVAVSAKPMNSVFSFTVILLRFIAAYTSSAASGVLNACSSDSSGTGRGFSLNCWYSRPSDAPANNDTCGRTGICLPSTLLTNKKLRFLFILAAISNSCSSGMSKLLRVMSTVTSKSPIMLYDCLLPLFCEQAGEVLIFI
ncbi:hypothetical protein D3C78_939230 [compost metagenome]